MNFTQDQIAAIIGNQYLEIVALRLANAELVSKLKEKEDGLHKDLDPSGGKLALVEGDKGPDDRARNAGREDRPIPR